MSELQYFWGWIIYLSGALGCILSLWFIVHKWHPRIKRALMITTTALFCLPGTFQPNNGLLGPALFICIYDGLSLGVDAMWRSGKIITIVAIWAAALGLILPVKQSHHRRKKQSISKQQRPRADQRKRKEPTYY